MGPTQYSLPAEWFPHVCTWLAWPHEQSDWPGKFEPIPHLYAEIVRLLVEAEAVRILVQPGQQAGVRRLLKASAVDPARVSLIPLATDRSWIRDYAPIFVHGEHGAVVASDWVFSGWAKYRNWEADNAVPTRLARRLAKDGVTSEVISYLPADGSPPRGVVLEGGAIDSNGAGCLLTTEQCMLSRKVQVRNPGMTREQLEEVFFEALGAAKVLWLGEGIAGDDTHGHVDDVARFVDEQTIVACVEPDPHDPNHGPLADNLKRMQSFRDARGRRFKVVKLPMPRPVVYAGQRLPASYANFYIANGLVLVPQFNDPADTLALETLAEAMPDRRVQGVYCRDLILGLGALHCMTMQQPAAHG